MSLLFKFSNDDWNLAHFQIFVGHWSLFCNELILMSFGYFLVGCSLICWFGWLFVWCKRYFVCCFVFWHSNKISSLPVIYVANIFPIVVYLLTQFLFVCLLTFWLLCVCGCEDIYELKHLKRVKNCLKPISIYKWRGLGGRKRYKGTFQALLLMCIFFFPQKS